MPCIFKTISATCAEPTYVPTNTKIATVMIFQPDALNVLISRCAIAKLAYASTGVIKGKNPTSLI